MKKNTRPDDLFAPYDLVFHTPDFPLSVKPRFSATPARLHTHSRFWEIVLVVAGSAHHRLDAAEHTIGIGDLFVIAPGSAHEYTDCQDFDYYNVLADLETLKLPMYDLVNTRIWQELFVSAPERARHAAKKYQPFRLDIQTLDRCSNLLNRMYKFQTNREPGYQFAILCCFYEFLRAACQSGEALSADRNDEYSLSVAVGDVATALERRCERHWTVQAVCRKSHLSRSVLFRLFQKYYHTSPMQFLTRQRIRKAMSLLVNSDSAMEDVALQCGFQNGSYFSTVFRRETGVTPLQYRRHPEIKNKVVKSP